ncbi:uncharacterized protein B0I36DRAFT_348044 [Microdochium trichocladiopsis]|uniref:Uncharacterized protein n=1 Tax=Microdochium trichocladiopsis TaxID=1682393 RepID=A0A9P8Y986_9PEZI|nr:uncharacterized protein B0I36DRAFT_348044 [Microdochium trichocladiopsis]KAH7032896.1 hypothetical protein B0I36DRAFT_348044 [Microdochium trichocladiopsis]
MRHPHWAQPLGASCRALLLGPWMPPKPPRQGEVGGMDKAVRDGEARSPAVVRTPSQERARQGGQWGGLSDDLPRGGFFAPPPLAHCPPASRPEHEPWRPPGALVPSQSGAGPGMRRAWHEA